MLNKEIKDGKVGEEKGREISKKHFTQKVHYNTFQNCTVKIATDSYSKNCTKQFWKIVEM